MKNNICQFIEKIRDRPGMWLGRWEVERLELVLAGYKYSLHDLLPEDQWKAEIEILIQFQKFVEGKLNYRGGGKSWATLINEYSNEPSGTYKMFYLFWDEFLAGSEKLAT